MDVETFPAAMDAICDVCKKPYGKGDYIAIVGGEVHCQDCVIDLRLADVA